MSAAGSSILDRSSRVVWPDLYINGDQKKGN